LYWLYLTPCALQIRLGGLENIIIIIIIIIRVGVGFSKLLPGLLGARLLSGFF
jgi:hypothetical protein